MPFLVSEEILKRSLYKWTFCFVRNLNKEKLSILDPSASLSQSMKCESSVKIVSKLSKSQRTKMSDDSTPSNKK